MEGGPPGFGPGFTCPALLGMRNSGETGFAYGALTRCGRPFHAVPLPCGFVPAPRWAAPGRDSRNPRAATPAAYPRPGLGWCAFARRYSRTPRRFLFLGVLRCFSSPGCLPAPYLIQAWVAGHDPCWVPPFGDPRIKVCLPLPGAYRSLPRPSSTSCAKASAVRPRYLVHYLGRPSSNYF